MGSEIFPPDVTDLPLFDITPIIDRTYPVSFQTEDGTDNHMYIYNHVSNLGDANGFFRIYNSSGTVLYDLKPSELWVDTGGDVDKCKIATHSVLPFFDEVLGHIYIPVMYNSTGGSDYYGFECRMVVVDVTDGTVVERSNIVQYYSYAGWAGRQFRIGDVIHSIQHNESDSGSTTDTADLNTNYDITTNVLTKVTGGSSVQYADRPAGTCAVVMYAGAASEHAYKLTINFSDGTYEQHFINQKMSYTTPEVTRGSRLYSDGELSGAGFVACNNTSLDATEYYDLLDDFLFANFGVTEPVWRQ